MFFLTKCILWSVLSGLYELIIRRMCRPCGVTGNYTLDVLRHNKIILIINKYISSGNLLGINFWYFLKENIIKSFSTFIFLYNSKQSFIYVVICLFCINLYTWLKLFNKTTITDHKKSINVLNVFLTKSLLEILQPMWSTQILFLRILFINVYST